VRAALKTHHIDALMDLFQAGAYSELIEETNRLLADFPEHPLLYNVLGISKAKLELFGGAIKNYQKAIKYKPDYADAYNNLGNACRNNGDLEAAVTHYKKALSISPDSSEFHNNIGVYFQHKRNYNQAAESFPRAIALNPKYVNAYNSLGAVMMDLGNPEEAAEYYQKSIVIDEHNAEARHMLNALKNRKSEPVPQQYIRDLFDTYAPNFDADLIYKLNYKIPKELRSLLDQHIELHKFATTLDLGCGTGLMGVEIQGIAQNLIGVDLSQKMLKAAAKKAIYSDLVESDIIEYLAGTDKKFDLFTAADVFIYLGHLKDLFQQIAQCANSGAILLFSTEHLDGDGYELNQTGRFSHSTAYVENICEAIGAEILCHRHCQLQKDARKSILGCLYVVRIH
jgi:predicted TPR repeat methyltransferase